MTFLPIVERELRVAARRRGTYWLRFFFALAVIVIWFFLLILGSNSVPSYQKGKMLFMAIGILALGFCLLSGIFLTADCISEEKREGTLGLLFLTELKGYDITLGKLMATSLHAFYGVVAILPMLALPMLIGGVTAGEFWRITLVLVMTLLFSLSIGLLVSSLSRDTRQAMGGTLLALVILAGVLPVLWWLQKLALKGSVADFLLWPSPAYLYASAFDSVFRTRSGAGQFWASLLTIFSLGAGAFVLASLRLPHGWQEKVEAVSTSGKPRRGQRLRFGSAAFRAARRRFLDLNPFYWLASRDRLTNRMTWGILGALFAIWLCFFVACFSKGAKRSPLAFGGTICIAFGVHQILKILVAIEASRGLSEDRRSGALELLLVTPLPVTQILNGQKRALTRTFRGPMALALLTNIMLFWMIAGPDPLEMWADPAIIFLGMCVGGAMMLLADFFAMRWVGMWMALHTKRHHRAIFATLARVMLPSWIGILFFAFLTISNAVNSTDEFAILVSLWFLFSLILDAVVGTRAKVRLFQEFRLTPSAADVDVTNPGFTAVPTVLDAESA